MFAGNFPQTDPMATPSVSTSRAVAREPVGQPRASGSSSHTSLPIARPAAPARVLPPDIEKLLNEALRAITCTWDGCETTCASLSLYKLHMRRFHVSAVPGRGGLAASTSRQTQSDPCKLGICSYKAVGQEQLWNHILQTHVKPLLLRCPMKNCSISCASASGVSAHLSSPTHKFRLQDLPSIHPMRPPHRLSPPPDLPSEPVPVWKFATPEIKPHPIVQHDRARSVSVFSTSTFRSSIGMSLRPRREPGSLPVTQESAIKYEDDDKPSYRGGFNDFDVIDDNDVDGPKLARRQGKKLSIGYLHDPDEPNMEISSINKETRFPDSMLSLRRVPDVAVMPLSHGASSIPPPPVPQILPPDQVQVPLRPRALDFPPYLNMFPAFKASFLLNHERSHEYKVEDSDSDNAKGDGDLEVIEYSDDSSDDPLAFPLAISQSRSRTQSVQGSAAGSREASVVRRRKGRKLKRTTLAQQAVSSS